MPPAALAALTVFPEVCVELVGGVLERRLRRRKPLHQNRDGVVSDSSVGLFDVRHKGRERVVHVRLRAQERSEERSILLKKNTCGVFERGEGNEDRRSGRGAVEGRERSIIFEPKAKGAIVSLNRVWLSLGVHFVRMGWGF